MTEEIYASKKRRYIWYARFCGVTDDDDIGVRIKSFYMLVLIYHKISYTTTTILSICGNN